MFTNYFYGVKIPESEKREGRISYATLAEAFPHILCNDIMKATSYDEWEFDNGNECYEEYYDIYQYYIINGRGADILERETSELVWYNEELNLYVWGVTHFGTMWSGVPTEIKCGIAEEK